MRLLITSPLVLPLVPVAVAVVLLAARRSRDPHVRWASWVRAVAVGALVLALAAPAWDAAGTGMDVVVLVDASDSTRASRAEVDRWLAGVAAAASPGDRVAVAAVGRDAQVQHALREHPPGEPLSVRVDGSQTDLARGLRLARGLAGSEQRRRVVVLTDGAATRGDTAAALRELSDAGIALDVVPVSGGLGADVLVDGVSAPGVVRAGERYEVVVALRNTGTTEVGGELVMTMSTGPGAGEVEVHREAILLPPGVVRFAVPRTAADSGTVRYTARLVSAASTELRNDVGAAAVQIQGPASVLLVDGATGDGEVLARALEAGGLEVARRDVAEGFPALDHLLGHDAVVLVDVHHDLIGAAGIVALDTYVRDAGRGLVVVGGERSYGLGAYDGTDLEELLPVFARVQDPRRRPSVAHALVVDVSGSMAACHCRPAWGLDGAREVQGPNKTEISKRAVVRAIESMEAEDTVGILAFHTHAEWVLPLQHVPPSGVVAEAVATLTPDGDTRISAGLDEAIEGLRDAEARLRHIILFTDGFTEESGLDAVAARAVAEGITLSVVGTGEMPAGSTNLLERLAEAGRGRYYPGHDLSSIPAILASEVMRVERPLVEEGTFVPVVTANDPITEQLAAAPPLFGYVATTAKPTARTLLRVGDERDPLLASWQAGLGTVVAWTSDATTRWASAWAQWDGARDLWSSLVRATLPIDGGSGIDARARVSAGELEIEAIGGAGSLPAGVEVVTTVVDPSGARTELPLVRADLDRFTATLPADADGVYAVVVRATRDGVEVGRRTVTAIRSYPAEYAVAADGIAQAAALAPVDGLVDPAPADVFRREGTTPGRSPRDLTGWLLVVALVALPLDVGMRRLRPDPAAIRAWRPRRRVAGAEGTDTEAHSDDVPEDGPAGPAAGGAAPRASAASLLEARRRARRR